MSETGQYVTVTSKDERVQVDCTRYGHDRWGCTLSVNNRIEAFMDGTLDDPDDDLEIVARQLVNHRVREMQSRTPRRPMTTSESERIASSVEMTWIDFARNRRVARRMGLRECRDAIQERVGEPISISELSAWERRALGLPERKIVEAWAAVLKIVPPHRMGIAE